MLVQHHGRLLDRFDQSEYVRPAALESARLRFAKVLVEFVVPEQVVVYHRPFLQHRLLVVADDQHLLRPETQMNDRML